MQLKKDVEKKTIHVEFDSLEDLSNCLRADDGRTGSHGRSYINSNFCKFSYQEAQTFLENGWMEGVSKMDAIIREIEGSGDGEQSFIKYDVFGDFFNVGRFMSGEPECCGRFLKRKTKNQEINIMVNVSAPAYLDQGIMINRGAAIQALVDKLLDTHYVNLQFVEYVCGIGGYDMTITVNCDTRNFYSREAVAFMTGNPAFLRRICFVVNEIALKSDNLNGSGYGRPRDILEKDRKNIDLYFPSFSYGDEENKWRSVESSRKSIQKIIDEYQEKDQEADSPYMPPAPERKPAIAGVYGA